MPSFDIVNRIDLQEVDNAVNNTKREIATRYDFRNSNAEAVFDKQEKTVRLQAPDEMKMEALCDMFIGQSVKRKLDARSLEFGEPQPTSKGAVRVEVKILDGIDQDTSRKIVKMIKAEKLKVQAAMQDNQVRVTGKKIDDLQKVIQTLKAADLEIPLQFINMKN